MQERTTDLLMSGMLKGCLSSSVSGSFQVCLEACSLAIADFLQIIAIAATTENNRNTHVFRWIFNTCYNAQNFAFSILDMNSLWKVVFLHFTN